MKMYGPYDLEIKVYITDGEQFGKANVVLPRSEVPSHDTVNEWVDKAVEQVREQMGDEWRLCTKQEYYDQLMQEVTGTDQQFALPGGDDWDKP